MKWKELWMHPFLQKSENFEKKYQEYLKKYNQWLSQLGSWNVEFRGVQYIKDIESLSDTSFISQIPEI